MKPKVSRGIYKNMAVNVPKSARPLTARVKMSIFDTVDDLILDSKVLDGFGGSGNFSIEALSLGAKKVTIVEPNRLAVGDIRSNLNRLRVGKDKFGIWNMTFNKFMASYNGERFNIIFLDPPFKKGASSINFNRLTNLADNHALFILRLHAKEKFELNKEYFNEEYVKSIGLSRVYYFRIK